MADLFTVEQLDYLDKHFDNRYDKKFVLVDDCNEKQEKVNGRFANDDKRIDLILQNQIGYDKKIALNNKLTVAILCGIVTLVFTLIGILLGG
jgi:hypothetical protein